MYLFNNLSGTKGQRKDLRKNQTKAEKLLWSRLRREQLGYKFRRQHSFGKYIMDFYCSELWLAVEVDGSAHGGKTQQTRDKIRQRYLKNHLLTVIRFTNEQVLNDLETVLMKIKKTCDEIKNSPSSSST